MYIYIYIYMCTHAGAQLFIYIYIYIYIYTYSMRFAIPPRQPRIGGWRLGARSARFLLFGVICGLCGVLGDPLVVLGVPGGSLGAARDYLGCPWSSWEFVEVPGGSLRSRGLPSFLFLKSMKNMFFLFFYKSPKPPYS